MIVHLKYACCREVSEHIFAKSVAYERSLIERECLKYVRNPAYSHVLGMNDFISLHSHFYLFHQGRNTFSNN